MQWRGGSQLVAIAAAGAMTHVATSQPPRPVRYVMPAALALAVTGFGALIPAIVPRTYFDLFFAPVLVVALTLGFAPAILLIVLGAISCTAGLPSWHVDSNLGHIAALAPHFAQALLVATVGSIVRIALRAAEARPRRTGRALEVGAVPVGTYGAEHLTPREVEVLRRAVAGGGFDELAAELCVSRNTVKTHLAHCYGKLGAHNRAEAIVLGVRAGVLAPSDLDDAATAVADEDPGR